MSGWAKDFYQIQDAVQANEDLHDKVLTLVKTDEIHGKSTEGREREDQLREILSQFFDEDFDLDEAISAVDSELPRHESRHSTNNRVFPDGWQERIVRTQVSRFYNQSVLELLHESGEENCYIPHSSEEDASSSCTQELAGGEARVETLLDRLQRAYSEGEYHQEVKIPNHPHCTHTVLPLSEAE